MLFYNIIVIEFPSQFTTSGKMRLPKIQVLKRFIHQRKFLTSRYIARHDFGDKNSDKL